MQRWTNDYKIAERIIAGYRPVLPLQVQVHIPGKPSIKPVVFESEVAVLLEKPDADFRADQQRKHITNDLITGEITGWDGKELYCHVRKEIAIHLRMMTKREVLKLFFRKVFKSR